MHELIAAIDALDAKFGEEYNLPARRLIDPLLATWSEELDPGVRATLESFLTMLPARERVSPKEWKKFIETVRTAALVDA
jgi:hypothetical protein